TPVLLPVLFPARPARGDEPDVEHADVAADAAARPGHEPSNVARQLFGLAAGFAAAVSLTPTLISVAILLFLSTSITTRSPALRSLAVRCASPFMIIVLAVIGMVRVCLVDI